MKTINSNRRRRGMTLLETMVVMFLLALVGAVVLANVSGSRVRNRPVRIMCVSNLKQIGTAYRIWENDNGNVYPMQQTEALGGMQELLSNSVSAGQYAYLPYSIMQNEMGQSPKVVVCPSDERMANTNFFPGANAPKPAAAFKLGGTGTFDNTNVSYFCGVGALDTYPQSILGGDRNLGNGGADQDPFYGISGSTANPTSPCGADAIVNTNGQWVYAAIAGGGGHVDRSKAVGWSAKMHSAGNAAGAGNILLGDGSAQQCTSAGFRSNWLRNAGDLGNFASKDTIHSTARGDIRLLFP